MPEYHLPPPSADLFPKVPMTRMLPVIAVETVIFGAVMVGFILGIIPLTLFIVLVVALSLVTGLLVMKMVLDYQCQRLAALGTTFENLGLGFDSKPDRRSKREAFERAGSVGALSSGHAGVLWIAQGRQQNRDLLVFEHQSVGGGQQAATRQTHSTVVSVMCPSDWPVLRLRPEGIDRAIAALFGKRDFQVESEEFNRHWSVSIDQPKHLTVSPGVAPEEFALLVLSPEMQTFFLDTEALELWQIGAGAVTCLQRGPVDNDSIERTIARLHGFIKQLDPALAAQIGSGMGTRGRV